jgi:hypothetical protein
MCCNTRTDTDDIVSSLVDSELSRVDQKSIFDAGTVILVFPWSSNPANEPLLVAGRYYTTATFDLIIDGKVKSWDLRTDFEIYN